MANKRCAHAARLLDASIQEVNDEAIRSELDGLGLDGRHNDPATCSAAKPWGGLGSPPGDAGMNAIAAPDRTRE